MPLSRSSARILLGVVNGVASTAPYHNHHDTALGAHGSKSFAELPVEDGFRIGGNTRHQLLLLQAIPEVGPKKAEWLLNAFGSPAEIAIASVDQIATVKGIGPNTAKKIHRVFNGNHQ